MSTRYSAFDLRLCCMALLIISGMARDPSQRSFAQDDQRVGQSIAAIRGVGKEGAGFEKAIGAAAELRRLPVNQLAALLDGMKDTNPIAENWMRGLVFDVVRKSGEAPLEELRDYAMDRSRNPTGRGLAMELIRKQSPEAAQELIPQCLNDPSLPLREMAVEDAIEKAKQIAKEDPESAKTKYREALVSARHPKQLERLVDALRKLGDEDVSIGNAFAMITQWHSLAPLDNEGGVGFDTVFAPENEFASTGKVNLEAQYEGKTGSIRWRKTEVSGDQGEVDLATAYEKEKGAVAYLFTEFDSSEARPAEARLGCINANKVWINGMLVMANEVYHSGSMIDQYLADFQLNQGTNRILLKICQNEQEEPWAQDWKFQFRITDPSGKSLRSGD